MTDQPERSAVLLELEAALAEAGDARTSATAHAQDSLKALLLINGGAVVAILAFVGTLKVDSAITVELNGIRFALGSFSLGVFLAAMCSLALSWFFDTNEEAQKAAARRLLQRLGHEPMVFTGRSEGVVKAGGPLAFIAMLLIVCSAISFGVGANAAVNAIRLSTHKAPDIRAAQAQTAQQSQLRESP